MAQEKVVTTAGLERFDQKKGYLNKPAADKLYVPITAVELTNQDLNTYTKEKPGWYFASDSNTVANKPAGVDAFFLEVVRSAGGWTTQVMYPSNNLTNTFWMRTHNSGAWGAWTEKGKTGSTGATGADGYSPTVTVTKSGSVTTLKVTNKSGTTTVTVNDGAKGDKGDTGAPGPAGQDAINIAVTQAWSGPNLTMTAHVYRGGQELTDAQVSALGAIKWFKDGSNTAFATGKTATQQVMSKSVFEAKLETGRGTSMSTLARSSFTALPDLKPGGQNLLVHARVDGNNWNIGSGSTIAVENTDHGKALKVVVGAETASGVNGKTNFATSQTDALVPDTWYCWSFWIKSSVAIPNIGPSKVLHMQCRKSGEFSEANINQETNGLYFPKAVTANVWTQMHVQFQVKAKATFTPYIWYLPPNSTVYLKDFKLEEGTIPSGWSPGLLDSSVTSVTGHYCLSTSTSAPADSSFSTTMPTNWGSNTYMWAYETHNYGDGSSVNTPKHIVAVKGANGTSAGFGTPTASVDANIGTPSVTVTASGANTAKVFNFAFKNLKGQKGDKGDTAQWTGLEYFHTGVGTSGTDGWVKLLQFKVTGTYQNAPLMLSLARRGDPVPIFVSIHFQSANTADPGLQNFKATSNTGNVRLVKSAASTWDLWVQKSEGYDNVAVLRIYKAPYLAGIEVTKTNVQGTPPATNAHTPSLWGYSLPLATSSVRGGVQPVTKDSTMIDPVGVDSSGKLYAKGTPMNRPSGSLLSVTLNPNEAYHFGTMDSLVINLGPAPAVYSEYHFFFTSGANKTNLTLPSTVKLPDGFAVEANKTYEISIVDNLLLYQAWE